MTGIFERTDQNFTNFFLGTILFYGASSKQELYFHKYKMKIVKKDFSKCRGC